MDVQTTAFGFEEAAKKIPPVQLLKTLYSLCLSSGNISPSSGKLLFTAAVIKMPSETKTKPPSSDYRTNYSTSTTRFNREKKNEHAVQENRGK